MANRQRLNLLENVTADGAGEGLSWMGGRGSFVSYGTFGGGTITLELSLDYGENWVPVTTSTEAGVGTFFAPAGMLRASLSGSSGANTSAMFAKMP